MPTDRELFCSVLFAVLLLSAGCLSSARDIATDQQTPSPSEDSVDSTLIEWIKNASRTGDHYENLTKQAVETHERYWNDEMPRQEANTTLKSTAGALWNLSQDWKDASPYNDSHPVESVHTNLHHAGVNYALGVAGLWSAVVNDEYSQAIDGMDTINETHQSLRDARQTLHKIDPR